MTAGSQWRRVGLGPRLHSGSRPRSRRPLRQRLRLVSGLCLAVFLVLWLVLPYDNTVRLAVRWNYHRLQAALVSRPSERWVYGAQAEYPVDLGRDVVVILKTGYGTARERVPVWFEALSEGSELRDILVIADYASQKGAHFPYRGEELPVHDMVKRALDLPVLAGSNHPRAVKYGRLAAAVARGDDAEARRLSKAFGWELDALKDISCLEFAYEKFPNKKWYFMLDDDTFVVQPSLKPLLGHLNPAQPHYLGNAVGDFKARFAHGGSGVILSHAAMRSLIANPNARASAHVDALDDIWGDRLITKALLKLGIHLDETFSHLFNGEPPLLSKIRADRICSPVLSFHSIRSATKMRDVGDRFRNVSSPVLWLDLWEMHGLTPPWRQTDEALREKWDGWDHVGALDDSTLTVGDVATAKECLKQCDRRYRTCLAWTWESATRECHISPWMIVGEAVVGKVSGVNVPRARYLETNCILY